MIKLNLLPSYVLEVRKIRNVIITFLILLALEGGIIYKAYTDLQLQETWFTNDKAYFTKRIEEIKAAKSARDAIKGQAGIYRPYIDFFGRKAIIEYNNAIAATLLDAANAITTGQKEKPWFDELVVNKDGAVTAKGKIKGMISFLDYYFKMKESGYTLAPKAQPAASWNRSQWTLYDTLDVEVSGKVSKAFPAKPTPPGEKPIAPKDLYVPYKSTGGGAAAGGAPAGGAPAAAGGPAGAGGAAAGGAPGP
ncbi:MAG: hypothetical protein ACYDCO_21975 [Armatimonadota bacterium]